MTAYLLMILTQNKEIENLEDGYILQSLIMISIEEGTLYYILLGQPKIKGQELLIRNIKSTLMAIEKVLQ